MPAIVANQDRPSRLDRMPIDPALRRRFEPFAGYEQRALLADPALARRWEEAFCHTEGYERRPARVAEHHVDGPIGPFRVRTYEPDDEAAEHAPRPVLVWAHGGDFLAGSIDMVEGDVLSREIANRADAVVVSVDYHLAGGAVSYPTLHREVAAAHDWARQRYADATAHTLGGGSAGGNLALAAALELRDAARQPPDRLAIVYPALHRDPRIAPDVEAELATLPPMMQVDQRMLDFMFKRYTGDATDVDTALVAPGDGVDLTGLPPCLVLVSEYDGLRSSGERFADAARAAGVDVDLHVAKGMPHGHLNMTPLVPQTDADLDLLAAFVRGTSPRLGGEG
jgi:acetyl esterase/lipase